MLFGNCLLQWVPRHTDLFAQVRICWGLLDLLLQALEPVGVDLLDNAAAAMSLRYLATSREISVGTRCVNINDHVCDGDLPQSVY